MLDRRAADRRGREVADALLQARPDLLLVPGRVRSIAFGGGPEERPVLPDRAADAAAVEAVVGVGQAALFLALALLLDEEVLVDAPDGTRLIEARAVEVVGARLRGDVEHAAAGAAHLGVVGVDLDLHFLDRFDRRVQHRAADQLGDRHAVEQVVVGAHAAAAERDDRGVALILLPVELRIAGRHHGRNRDADEEGVAAGRRQRLERFTIEHAAGRRRRRVDQRRLAGDRDRLLERADLEHHVERDELLRARRRGPCSRRSCSR